MTVAVGVVVFRLDKIVAAISMGSVAIGSVHILAVEILEGEAAVVVFVGKFCRHVEVELTTGHLEVVARELLRDGGVARLVLRVERGVVERVVVSIALAGIVHVVIRTHVLAVLCIDAAVGVHAVVFVEQSVGRVVALVVVHGQLVAELQVLHAVGQHHTAREGVSVGALHGAAYSVVGQVHAILHRLVATLQV